MTSLRKRVEERPVTNNDYWYYRYMTYLCRHQKAKASPLAFLFSKRTPSKLALKCKIKSEIKSSYIPTFKVATCPAKIVSRYSFETD